jgi:2-amino-4-hydroxy-6-hydroxymethyldihydropteridine diphosphokinase
VGKLDQPDFINAVAKLQTELSAVELMGALQAIETKHHRVRGEANDPRTLDLDLLLFGNDIIRESSLTVPHPRMHERAFVLMPLAEFGGGQTNIPGRGTVASLLAQVADQRIKKLDAEQETSLHRR